MGEVNDEACCAVSKRRCGCDNRRPPGPRYTINQEKKLGSNPSQSSWLGKCTGYTNLCLAVTLVRALCPMCSLALRVVRSFFCCFVWKRTEEDPPLRLRWMSWPVSLRNAHLTAHWFSWSFNRLFRLLLRRTPEETRKMAAAFMSRKPSVNHVTLVIFLEFFAWGLVTRSSHSQTTLYMT